METFDKKDKKIYKILDFKDFPPILGQSITIDQNIIIYRAYDIKYGAIQRPSFFGEHSIASRYAKDGRKLSAFITKRPIKLLDIRYVSQIINQLILLREDKNHIEMVHGYMTLALSFGLISLQKQMELYKMRYRDTLKNDIRFEKINAYYKQYQSSTEKFSWQNPIELQGIRIGETNNDTESTLLLKEIFGEFFDGIIFPTMFSPYFDDNYIPNEILLFEPSKCVVENEKNIIILNTNYASYIDIMDIIRQNNIMPFQIKNHKNMYYQYGGVYTVNNSPNYIFEKNNMINTYYETNAKDMKRLKKIGKLFKAELFDKNPVPRINYMNERNDAIAARASMEFDPSGWK